MVAELQVFEPSSEFCLWGLGLKKSEACKSKDTPDELLASILDAAVRERKKERRKNREYQLRRTTRDLRTRDADRILEHLL
jgi:hypothetical protein